MHSGDDGKLADYRMMLQVPADQAPYLCLDLTFQHTLLTKGFKIPDSTKVSLVKRVKYKSQEVEAAWPLGVAINLLSMPE